MSKKIALATILLALSLPGCNVNIMTNIIPSKPVNSQTINPALEQTIHEQVNQYRKSQNLPPLTLDERISEQARIHSENMANKTVPFSHQGFETRITATKITYQSAAENVAYNQGHQNPATVAVEGWIKSPGHQKNMVGNFNLTGVGVAKNAAGEYYFTQIFILQR